MTKYGFQSTKVFFVGFPFRLTRQHYLLFWSHYNDNNPISGRTNYNLQWRPTFCVRDKVYKIEKRFTFNSVHELKPLSPWNSDALISSTFLTPLQPSLKTSSSDNFSFFGGSSCSNKQISLFCIIYLKKKIPKNFPWYELITFICFKLFWQLK